MVQLWVNLPAKDKMAAPAYQGITANQIPTVNLRDGAGTARIIAGTHGATQGPARTFTPMNVWDMRLQVSRIALTLPLTEGHGRPVRLAWVAAHRLAHHSRKRTGGDDTRRQHVVS